MPTIDRKPSDPPPVIEVAAMLAIEGNGCAARAVRECYDREKDYARRLLRLRELAAKWEHTIDRLTAEIESDSDRDVRCEKRMERAAYRTCWEALESILPPTPAKPEGGTP